MLTLRCSLSLAGLLLVCGSSHAEEWRHELAPYVFAAGMDGEVGVGAVNGDVDVSFGDVLENLDWGAMLAYRGTRGPWSIAFDGIYMDLEGKKNGAQGAILGEAEVQQTALEVDVGYAVAERITAFAGLRYNDLDADVKVRGAGPLGTEVTAGSSESWIDPVIGALTEIPINDKWSASLRGDIGGFGVGSDFAWQVIALVRWQATPSLAVGGGYRYFDQDYEDGSGSDYFKYDVASSGPVLGVAFTF